jgi:hypothetical protein
MYAGARRSADAARVDDAARAQTAAPAAAPPVEHIADGASRSTAVPAAAARGDALGAMLARAVRQRASDTAVTPQEVGATLQRLVATQASDLDKHISTSQSVKRAFGKGSASTKDFAEIRRVLANYQSAVRKGGMTMPEDHNRTLVILGDLCKGFLTQHAADKRRAIVDRLLLEVRREQWGVLQDIDMERAHGFGETFEAFGPEKLDPLSERTQRLQAGAGRPRTKP